jgi:hypothetical protein
MIIGETRLFQPDSRSIPSGIGRPAERGCASLPQRHQIPVSAATLWPNFATIPWP